MVGDVHDVLVGEAAHHLDDGVDFADVLQELVAQALTLRGALHQAGDIHELEGRGNDHLGLGELRERRQPIVGHHHDADVGLDGAERIVRGLGLASLGEGVEERGLANVRQADDAGTEHGDFLSGVGARGGWAQPGIYHGDVAGSGRARRR